MKIGGVITRELHGQLAGNCHLLALLLLLKLIANYPGIITVVQPHLSITHEKFRARSLVARSGVVPYGRHKILPLETRAEGHFKTGELNAKMRSKIFFFDFCCFLVQWETFSDRIFAFDRFHWRIVFFGSGFHCEVFMVSLLTDRTRASYETNEFPRHHNPQRRRQRRHYCLCF